MQLIHRILERKKNIMLSRTLQGRPHLRGVVLKYIHKTKKANSAIRKIAKYD
jgi:ribosomal protein S12